MVFLGVTQNSLFSIFPLEYIYDTSPSIVFKSQQMSNMTVTLSHGYSVFFLIHPLRLSILQLSQTSQNKVPSRLAPWAPHRYRSSCEENRFLPFDAFRPWQKKTARCRIYFMFLCDPFLMVFLALCSGHS